MNAPDGLCPACLLKAALGAAFDLAEPDDASPTERQYAALTPNAQLEKTHQQHPPAGADEFEAQPREFGVKSNGGIVKFCDYELLEEIGSGGMGVVYRARQIRLNRQVALKMIRAGRFSSETEIQRLRSEAQAAAQLDHPGIVPVFEVSEHEGLHFFTMALVDGQTLSAKLNDGPLPIRKAASIMQSVAAAVAYAHSKGVIHRDIKPGNILIDRTGQPRVSDFGLAKQISIDSELTITGQILGTPSYMPPEQALGNVDEIGASADIYSLGAVLYACLTGRPPFQAQTSVETLRLVVDRLPLAPRLLNPSVPKDLETICLKCLEKLPTRRYESAHLLTQELRCFLNGEPIVARPAGRLKKLARWYRRYWPFATTAAAIAVMIASVAIILALTTRRLNTQLAKTETAEKAERLANIDSQAKLWVSYLSEANAKHRSRQSGQRFGALLAVENALKLPVPEGRSRDELRTAAIAAVCLPDLVEDLTWPHSQGSSQYAVDPLLRLNGYDDPQSGIFVVRDMRADQEILRIPRATWEFEHKGPGFSPDARQLIYPKDVEGRPRLHLWDTKNRHKPLDLGETACSVTFSPDNQRFAVASLDGRVRIFNCLTLEPLHDFASDMKGPVVAWNPRFPQLALLDIDGWKVIDTETGGVLSELKVWQGLAGWPDWHPSGRRISAATNQQEIRIWDSQTTELLANPLVGHRRGGTIVRFSPSGNQIVSNDWGQFVRLWDVRSGQQLMTAKLSGVKLEFSADGSHLGADCSVDALRFLRYSSGAEFRTIWEYSGRSSDFNAVHSTPCLNGSGRLLAMASESGICLVDLHHDEVVCHLPLAGNGPFRFHKTAEGEFLWTYGANGVLSWPIEIDEVRNEGIIKSPEVLSKGPGAAIWACSANGSRILIPAVSGGYLWSRLDNKDVVLPHPPDIRTCAMSADGRIGATGSHAIVEHGAKVWDLETKSLLAELTVGPGGVFLSPDGKWLVTNGGRTLLWRVGDWENPRELLATDGHACFSSDSRLLALSDDISLVRLINPETASVIAVLTAPERTPLSPLLFSNDNTRLVTLGNETAALHIFDLSAIRRHLRGIELDWEADEYPDSVPKPRSIDPISFRIQSATTNDVRTAQRLTLPKDSDEVQVLPGTELKLVSAAPGLGVLRQQLDVFGPNLQSTSHLLLNGRRSGDFLEFDVPVRSPGKVRLSVQLTMSYDFGIVAFQVNGRPVKEKIDTYEPDVMLSPLIELGEFDAGGAPLRVRIEVVDTNRLSKAPHYYFAIGAVVVEQLDKPALPVEPRPAATTPPATQ